MRRTLSRPRRTISVYDAVAGRATASGRAIPGEQRAAVAPEEALFKRVNAPVRYEEDDFYFAHEHLRPEQELPDSDLLKTLHCFASDFYSRATTNGGKTSWSSFDGTALLVLGILLEETAESVLGKDGHRVFLSPVEEEQKDKKGVDTVTAYGKEKKRVDKSVISSRSAKPHRKRKWSGESKEGG